MEERQFDSSLQITLAENGSADNQTISMGGEAFEVRALCCTSTGTFKSRIKDGSGRNCSDNLLNNANLWGTRANPTPVYPPFVIPAGGRIGVDLVNTYAGSNAIELVFIGVKLTQSAG
jgi:hypothetical protein